MPRSACWLLLTIGSLSLVGCKEQPTPEVQLLAEVRKALSERDQRLSSYHLAATSKEGDAVATHELFYRAPNRSRGVVTAPEAMTVSFDGTRLFKLLPAAKKLEVYELKLPVDKASYFLATTFTPFVPEGFRTPLLPMKGLAAKRVTHPKGPEAVALTVSTKDEQGGAVEVTYVLRYPTGDFLSKRTSAGGHLAEAVVMEEHCSKAPALCVPKVVQSFEDGKAVHTLTLTTIELNVPLPNDGFSLTAPEGYVTEPHELVEAGK